MIEQMLKGPEAGPGKSEKLPEMVRAILEIGDSARTLERKIDEKKVREALTGALEKLATALRTAQAEAVNKNPRDQLAELNFVREGAALNLGWYQEFLTTVNAWRKGMEENPAETIRRIAKESDVLATAFLSQRIIQEGNTSVGDGWRKIH